MGVFVLILALATVAVPNAGAEEALVVQVGHGKLLRLNNIQRVLVAAPDVADVNVISRRELMIIAKRVGETTLNVWMPAGVTSYRVVVVGASGPEVGDTINEVLGGSGVQARAVGDAVVLQGTVKDEAAKARAETIASAFSKRVINLLTVEQATLPPPLVLEGQLREALKNFPVTVSVGNDSVRVEGTVATRYELQQVETIAKTYAKNVSLLVRVKAPVQIQIQTIIAEIDRTALNNLGITYGGQVPGDVQGNTFTPFIFNFGLVPGGGNIALNFLVARLNLLQQRNAARTLSNPRLVVAEGGSSKLLVGGEIPIPTVGALGQTNVTFQPFGVRLEFKPVYRPDEPIALDLLTEVSSLDFANAVVANGFTIPALRVRRLESVVNLRPGEFLAIGGLLSRDDSKVVNKIPILGDIPIIGALFRSTSFSKGESELVIFVSPSIVAATTEAPQLPQVPNPDTLNP
jgi:pilus assembly protein CpaC